MKPVGKKVIVGMSGGVDSSVAAAILKQEGYEVHGVFIMAQDNIGEEEKNAEDVRRVCEILDIPFHIIDGRKKFKEEVIGYFLEEYRNGRTPNPCVFCNKNFKFQILFSEMMKLKADWVATGHYARITQHATRNTQQLKYKLIKAADKSKDQSYFLYRLKEEQLAKIIFPLGEYRKSEVRAMAKKFGLPVSEKRESQDICFMAGTDVASFLRAHLGKLRAGKIVSQDGQELGKHKGLPLYTIGQRKGIEVGGTGPYYVTAKDEKNNVLIVASGKEQNSLYKKEAELEEVNWISEASKRTGRILVKVRYQTNSVYGIIKKYKAKDEEYKIIFDRPQRAVTAGQSAVFYGEDGEVLGGGIIVGLP